MKRFDLTKLSAAGSPSKIVLFLILLFIITVILYDQRWKKDDIMGNLVVVVEE